MRKSVERRKRDETTAQVVHTKHSKSRRRVILLVTVIVVLVGGVTVGVLQLMYHGQTVAQKITPVKQTTATPNSLDKLLAAANQAEATTKEQTSKSIQSAQSAIQQPASSQQPVSTGTTASARCDVNNPTSISVVVNKKHCINPPSWAPSDLTNVAGYLMRAVAAGSMQQMMNAAAAAGQGFSISSAYRSYSDQVATYNNWVQVNGSTAAADTVSARPGYSEHQTGLAADLKVGGCALECFANTSQYQWLSANAASYGFIQRYPVGLTSITGYSPEQWHWRYVGSATALAMKAQGIQTLEEYFNISGGDYN